MDFNTAMPRERLQRLLRELNRELESGEDLSSDETEQLHGLLARLNEVVDEDVDSDDESVLSELRQARARFESSHPKLTDALASASELLRSIGIS
jgi:predicted transcriptional regulator